tara:strand:+ start:305 stop:664 length:360 start_codon:yes stop_codon:yes gene_type:complete
VNCVDIEHEKEVIRTYVDSFKKFNDADTEFVKSQLEMIKLEKTQLFEKIIEQNPDDIIGYSKYFTHHKAATKVLEDYLESLEKLTESEQKNLKQDDKEKLQAESIFNVVSHEFMGDRFF